MSRQAKFSVMAGALSSDARDAVARAQALGFGGLVFDAVTTTLDLTELSITGRREFRHVLESGGQTLVALRSDLGPNGFAPGTDVDHILARLHKVFEAARESNAACVTIDLGPLPAPTETVAPTSAISPDEAGLIIIPAPRPRATTSAAEAPPPDPRIISHVDAAMLALGELADRYRVRVAFSSSLAGFAAIQRTLEAARCPWFGVDLDPVAILRDRWSAHDIFSRLGQSLYHVRARDATVGAERRTRTTELGRGSVKWDELLNSLEAAGYHAWLTIDPIELPDPTGAATRGLQWLTSLTGRRADA